MGAAKRNPPIRECVLRRIGSVGSASLHPLYRLQTFRCPGMLSAPRFSCRRIPPSRDWAREGFPDAPVVCFGRGGSHKRKHRTSPSAVSANGCLVARTLLVSPAENRKNSSISRRAGTGRISEPIRRAAGVPCPNADGLGTGRASDELYAMLPILAHPAPRPP